MGVSKRDKDASRSERKAKKRKLEDAIPDLPGDAATQEEQNGAVYVSKKRKHSTAEVKVADGSGKADTKAVKKAEKLKNEARKEKNRDEGLPRALDAVGESEGEVEASPKKKKKKSSKLSDDLKEDTTVDQEDQATSEAKGIEANTEEQPRKSKKLRKAERKAAEAAPKSSIPNETRISTSVSATGEAATAVEEQKADVEKAKKNNRNRDKKRKAKANGDENAAKTSPRFIVFIGNLPFTATTESIKKHFESVKPKSIRHLTKKEDASQSRGCAFVEFDGYDHMKTCLKLFHHSTFDDGLSAPRKINVDLTVGGGGKTKQRLAKIEDKNNKLNEQRVRRMHEEEKAKLEKREAKAIDINDVHPSRRARVPDLS